MAQAVWVHALFPVGVVDVFFSARCQCVCVYFCVHTLSDKLGSALNMPSGEMVPHPQNVKAIVYENLHVALIIVKNKMNF